MGVNEFAWAQWGVFARGNGKTRGNEAKIGGQDMFCRCGHEQQKHQVVGRDDRGGAERLQGEYLHIKGFKGYLYQSTRSYCTL